MGSPETSQSQKDLGKVCGNCTRFRTTWMDGKPVGQEYLSSEQTVTKGLCNAPFGLVLGVLNEVTKCRQPTGVFQPISSNENTQAHL